MTPEYLLIRIHEWVGTAETIECTGSAIIIRDPWDDVTGTFFTNDMDAVCNFVEDYLNKNIPVSQIIPRATNAGILVGVSA